MMRGDVVVGDDRGAHARQAGGDLRTRRRQKPGADQDIVAAVAEPHPDLPLRDAVIHPFPSSSSRRQAASPRPR